jgi:hypothetical protein
MPQKPQELHPLYLAWALVLCRGSLIYNYYNGILGTLFQQQHSLHLYDLLPQLYLTSTGACILEEIWATIKGLSNDRAPGPNGFTRLFYKVSRGINNHDVINASNALRPLDAMSFHLLNDALMVLLPKKEAPTQLKDYRLIS